MCGGYYSQRGDTSFFQWVKGGDLNFFEGHRGGDQDSFIIYVRGCSFTREGPDFFCVGQGGDQNFFAHAEGGTRKNGDPGSQSDGHPSQ